MSDRAYTIIIGALIVDYFAVSLVSSQYNRVLADRSPFRSDDARADLRGYYGFRANKAFAASVTLSFWGWSYGQPDGRNAETLALKYCERRGEPCQLYAVGNKVVWDNYLARRTLDTMVSSQELHGALWRFYGESNPHGVTIVLPSGAPSIISDYQSTRGVMGRLRADFPEAPPRHGGIDIIAPTGSPVLAAADGEVLASHSERIAGLNIRIAHRAAEDEVVMITNYIHLEDSFVERGDTVVRGQTIGTVGISGEGANRRRPHLHFETRGSNPHLFWHDGQGLITCFEPSRAYTSDQTRLTYPLPCGLPEENLQAAH